MANVTKSPMKPAAPVPSRRRREKRSGIPYDAAFRLLFSETATVASLLRAFLPPGVLALLDLGKLTRLPEQHVSARLKRRCNDLVWRMRRRDGTDCYLCLLLEFQSGVDPLMPLRMHNYVGDVLADIAKTRPRPRVLPAVLPFVLYTGERRWGVTREVRDLFGPLPAALRPFCPQLRYYLLDVGAVAPASLNRASGLAAQAVRLLHARRYADAKPVLSDLTALLRGQGDESLTRAVDLFVNTVIAGRWKHGSPTEMAAVKSWGKMRRMFGENIDWAANERKYVAEITAKAEAKGLTQGRAEGMRTMIETLMTALRQRFGQVPPEMQSRIERSTDMGGLQRLILSCFNVPSLSAFGQRLEQEAP